MLPSPSASKNRRVFNTVWANSLSCARFISSILIICLKAPHNAMHGDEWRNRGGYNSARGAGKGYSYALRYCPAAHPLIHRTARSTLPTAAIRTCRHKHRDTTTTATNPGFVLLRWVARRGGGGFPSTNTHLFTWLGRQTLPQPKQNGDERRAAGMVWVKRVVDDIDTRHKSTVAGVNAKGRAHEFLQAWHGQDGIAIAMGAASYNVEQFAGGELVLGTCDELRRDTKPNQTRMTHNKTQSKATERVQGGTMCACLVGTPCGWERSMLHRPPAWMSTSPTAWAPCPRPRKTRSYAQNKHSLSVMTQPSNPLTARSGTTTTQHARTRCQKHTTHLDICPSPDTSRDSMISAAKSMVSLNSSCVWRIKCTKSAT